MTDHQNTSHSTEKVMDLTLLWGKAQGSVKAYISAVVPNVHDRDDVLQSTVQYLVENFSDYDPERPFVAWAIGIARYRILEYRQKQSKRGKELGSEVLEIVSQTFVEHAGDHEPRYDALKMCLQMLNQKQLRIISRRYYDGVSNEVIAKEFGTKPNSMAVMIRRIRMALGKCIEARIESEAC